MEQLLRGSLSLRGTLSGISGADPVASLQYSADDGTLVFLMAPVVALLMIIPFEYMVYKSQRLPQNHAPQPLAPSKLLRGLLLIVVESSISYYETQRTASTDAFLYVVACVPSVAAIANVHDYYHQHGTTFSVRLYLVIVCLADVSRATYYSAQNYLLAAALSGLAVLLNWPQIMWLWEYLSPSRKRLGHRIWRRYHNLLVRTSITRRLYEFLSIGSRQYQSVNDLPRFPDQSGPRQLCDKFELVWSTANKRSQLVLIKVILRVLFWPHMSILLPVVCCQACQLFLAILMRRTIRLISESPSPNLLTRAHLVMQTGAVSMILMVFAVWRAKMRGTFNILLRSLLSSVVLKKSLRLYLPDAHQDQVSTNLNSELEQLMSSMERYHRLAFAPVEICMGLFTFYYYDGVIALLMLPPLFIALAISCFVGHIRMNATLAWGDRVKERTAKSFQILASIKDIKILGLESVMIRYLQQFRSLELTAAQTVQFFSIIATASTVLVTDVSPLTIMAGRVFWTKSIVDMKAVAVFSTMAFVTAIVEPSMSLVQDTPTILTNIKPIRNLQAFLLLPDKPDLKPVEGTSTQDEAKRSMPRMHSKAMPFRQQGHVSPVVVVDFRKVSIATQPGHLPLFSNVTLSITAGSTVMVTGPIGSGKTSFLRAIVGEAHVLGGSLLMQIDTQSIAYCGQIAWLRNTTIRSNIVDKCEFDEEWYRAVLLVTFLTEDIERLQDGDLYLVGTGGSKLSGGQRQRIAIARALYSKAQLIIFDDVLSVLDADTASAIFTELIGSNGLLVKLGITVVMSTFSANFLGVADQVIFINDNHQLKVATGEAEVERAIIDYVNPETPVPIDFDVIQTKKALTAYNNLMDLDNRTQLAIEQENWGEFDTGGYVLLLQLISKPILFKWLILIALFSLSGRAPDTFTRIWADLAPTNLALFWVYGLIIFLRVVVVLYEGKTYHMSAVPLAAMKLHEDLLQALMRKPLLILAAMDDGFLFNRIIGDVNIVSDDWPLVLKAILNAGTLLFWDVCLITYGVPVFFVMIPPLIVSIFWIQKLCLGTAQQLRTFRSANKATLFSQITEVRSGLEHIRTMGYRDRFFRKYLHILEDEQRISATSLKSQLWRLMCQYLLTTMILITVTISGTSGRAGITVGGVGLAWLLGQWTWLVIHNMLNPIIYLEESSASAARLKAFMALEPEANNAEIPEDWPATGSIKFDNVNATYTTRAESYTALHEVSFEIDGGKKVGVIGPTGSGKSTLILTILNHMDYVGSITIDGVELSTIPRERRQNLITVIMQQPAKLPGTLRNNLLPWEISIDEHAVSAHADEELYDLLEQLGLRTHVEFNGGLDILAEDMNFSFGQRQLVSIAMAILHNRSFRTKIVLLDEVTSAMDSQLDDKVHAIMKTAFEGSTIFVVAHRTDLLYYVDTIAELERGWLTLSEPPL